MGELRGRTKIGVAGGDDDRAGTGAGPFDEYKDSQKQENGETDGSKQWFHSAIIVACFKNFFPDF